MDAKRAVGLAGFAADVREGAADAPRDSTEDMAARVARLLEWDLQLAEEGIIDPEAVEAMVDTTVILARSSERLRPLVARYGLVRRRERMVPALLRRARPRGSRRRSARTGPRKTRAPGSPDDEPDDVAPTAGVRREPPRASCPPHLPGRGA